MKRRQLLLLSLTTAVVAAAASFATATYAGYVKRSALSLETSIAVKRTLYLKTNGNSSWNTNKFAIWVWKSGASGAFADPDLLMEYAGTANVYRASIPAGMNYALFVCFTDGDFPDWNKKKSQTVDIALSDNYDTYAINGEKTGDNFNVTPTQEHNS